MLIVCLCVLACGCQEDILSDRKTVLDHRSKGSDASDRVKSFSFVEDIDLLYNESFSLSPQEDLRAFYDKLSARSATVKQEQSSVSKVVGSELCGELSSLFKRPESTLYTLSKNTEAELF